MLNNWALALAAQANMKEGEEADRLWNESLRRYAIGYSVRLPSLSS